MAAAIGDGGCGGGKRYVGYDWRLWRRRPMAVAAERLMAMAVMVMAVAIGGSPLWIWLWKWLCVGADCGCVWEVTVAAAAR